MVAALAVPRGGVRGEEPVKGGEVEVAGPQVAFLEAPAMERAPELRLTLARFNVPRAASAVICARSANLVLPEIETERVLEMEVPVVETESPPESSWVRVPVPEVREKVSFEPSGREWVSLEEP